MGYFDCGVRLASRSTARAATSSYFSATSIMAFLLTASVIFSAKARASVARLRQCSGSL